MRNCLLFVLATLPVMTSRARADIELRLTSGGASVSILDGGAGDMYKSVPGVITYIGTVGNWILNVTTGLADPVKPIGELDLNSVDVSSSNVTEPLTIAFTRYNSALPTGWASMEMGGTTGGPTVTYTAYWGVSAFDESNTIGTLYFSGQPAFSGTTGGSVSGSVQSLTQKVVLGATPSSHASFNATLNVQHVPEAGGSLLLLLGASLGLLMLIRLRTA